MGGQAIERRDMMRLLALASAAGPPVIFFVHHVWTISTHEDVSPQEIEKRFETLSKNEGA